MVRVPDDGVDLSSPHHGEYEEGQELVQIELDEEEHHADHQRHEHQTLRQMRQHEKRIRDPMTDVVLSQRS